jgi:hypothetical protein
MIFFLALAACYAIAFFLLTHKVVDKSRSIIYSVLFGIIHSYGFSRVLGVIALLIFWRAFGAGMQGPGNGANMPILLAVCALILIALEQLWIMLSLTFSKVPLVVKRGVIFLYAVVLAVCDMAIGAAWYPTAEFPKVYPNERNEHSLPKYDKQ